MTAGSTQRLRAREVGPASSRVALAVADTNFYTTKHLFGEVENADVDTLLLDCVDYRNAWNQGRPPWRWSGRLERCGPRHWERDLVLPTGWMKRFPRWGMRPIARAIQSWRAAEAPGASLALVMTYPHFLFLRDQLRPERTVYYNIDDYTLYWPRSADVVRRLERRIVLESDLTVCVAGRRADELRAAIPEAAERIRHLPHGTPRDWIPDAPFLRPGRAPEDLAHLPRPWLGFVGSLSDRIDWRLVDRLATDFPAASIVLIGSPPALPVHPQGPLADAARCLARPNVHAVGWRPQHEISRYYRAFDISLIPYLIDHPFNIACCPTKIMDTMPTGRPIVSTALPECRLYESLFDVAVDHDAFIAAVGSILARDSNDGRCLERHAWARAHACPRVAEQILDWVLDAPPANQA